MTTAVQQSRTHPPLAFNIGDDWFIEVECKSADGSPLDLRGAEVEWRLTDMAGNTIFDLTVGAGVAIEPAFPPVPYPNVVMIRLLPAQTSQIVPGRYQDRTRVRSAHGIVSTQSTGPIDARASDAVS
jgi:hypothetical protein